MARNSHAENHFADWPGGSGHCICMCPACFAWLTPHPDTGKSRGGRCACKDCPCGGHEFMLSASLPRRIA